MASHAKKGYYALQDYTVQYWFDHLLDCIESLDPRSEGDRCQDVFNLAMVFLRSYGHRYMIEELLQAKTYLQLAEAIQQHLPTHGQERNPYFCIDIRTEALRQKIVKLDFGAFTAEEQKVFAHLHGPCSNHGSRPIYKCSKPWCDSFKGGLASQADRQKHIDEHEFPHRCAFDDCMVGFELGFSTKDELQKHNEKWHAQKDDANSFPSSFSEYSGKTNLFEACERGDIERVKQLLETEEGKEEIHKITEVKKGSGDWTRKCPLSIAAEMGHTELCSLLISNGASIDIDEGAALRAAAREGHLVVCGLLISNYASIDVGDRTALEAAAEGGHMDVCKLLISHGASTNPPRRPPLVAAAQYGHYEVCELLISPGASIEIALAMAASWGHPEVCKLLISNGASVNIMEGAPLRNAAREGHLEVCKLLISNGASIDICEGMPLQIAADWGRLEVCKLLISNGASVNITEGAPLRNAAAAYKGHLEVCKLLIQEGADMNIVARRRLDGTETTPLMEAVERGNVNIIKLLLDQEGIQPNKQLRGPGGRFRTPAKLAASRCDVQALRIMQSSGKADMGVGLLRACCENKTIADSLNAIMYLLNHGYAVEADEECVWSVLKTLRLAATKDFTAKVRSAVDMLLNTGNPVFNDVGFLARNLSRGIGRRIPLWISIMEYPKWKIKRSARLSFLEKVQILHMNDELKDELKVAIDRFIRGIEDNRATTIIDDEPKVKGKGRSTGISAASDEEMGEGGDEEDDSS